MVLFPSGAFHEIVRLPKSLMLTIRGHQGGENKSVHCNIAHRQGKMGLVTGESELIRRIDAYCMEAYHGIYRH